MSCLSFLLALFFQFNSLVPLLFKTLLLISSHLDISDSDLNGKSQPLIQLRKCYRIVFKLFLVDGFKILLNELQFFILFKFIFLLTDRPVVTDWLKEIVIKNLFHFFPVKVICISVANILAFLVLEQIENSLPNSLILDSIDVLEVHDLSFPLFWHEREILPGHRFVITSRRSTTHGTLYTITSSRLVLLFFHPIQSCLVLSS